MDEAVSQQLQELDSLSYFYPKNMFKFKPNQSLDQKSHPFLGNFIFYPSLHDKSLRIIGENTTKSRTSLPLAPHNMLHRDLDLLPSIVYHLPCISIDFCLPSDYPSAAPSFTVSCVWLPKIMTDKIVNNLTESANLLLGTPMLWQCFDNLETTFPSILNFEMDETANYVFNLSRIYALGDDSADVPGFYESLRHIMEYNYSRTTDLFNKSEVYCSVCGEVKFGQKCIRLRTCGHEFCKDCLCQALKIHLHSGVLGGLLNCLQCNNSICLNDVKEFSVEALFNEYDNLLLRRSLDKMPDVIRCPKAECNNFVWVENEVFALCNSCKFAFCSLCLRSYHPGRPCFEEAKKEEAVNEKTKCETALDLHVDLCDVIHELDRDRRLSLLQAYISNLEYGVGVDYAISNECKNEGLNRCPSCGIYIEKVGGCSYVKCAFCGYGFTWS